MAPHGVRSGIVERIEREMDHVRAGRPGLVQIKVNSLVDEELIDALYRASRAGVQVDLIVRGICALRPGVAGLSERIRVRSIEGRFLEINPAYLTDASLPPLSPFAQTFSNGRTLMDARALDAWSKSTRRALRTLDPVHFGYSDPAGEMPLRAAIADYLRAARGVVCEPEQVIVTSGAQQAVDLSARLLLKPRDPVWLEDPGYQPTWHALTATGADITAVPVDRSGLVVKAGIAAAPAARAAFVTPSHQYPLGVALSMGRRLELIAWARAAGAWIVEDDYAAEFRYEGAPLASLQGLDGGERVIYVGTLNKALFPGLRLGYLVAPRALAEPLAAIRRLADRQPPTITQAITLDFLQSGQFAAHIRRRRLAYKAQRDALAAALNRRLGQILEPDVPDQGMHLIAYLKDGRSDLEVEAAAEAKGVIARAISRLYHAAEPRSGLILGFTGFPANAMDAGVARLAAALEA